MAFYPWKLPDGVHNVGHQAHPQDSLAVAEHVPWEGLREQLATYEGRSLRPKHLLDRAWLRVEYALATPDTEHDNKLFKEVSQDVATVMHDSSLGVRHPIRVNAALLSTYDEVFRLRAQRKLIPPETQAQLQKDIGSLLIDFMADGDISADDLGPLSELVAPYGLLYADTLPYLASPREEGNTYADDNHDFYTIHPCDTNLVKKVPISVKHLEDYNLLRRRYNRPDTQPLPVATVKIGRIALATAAITMPYAIDRRYEEHLGGVVPRATRLAADIMACHASEDNLEACDQQFLTTMSLGILEPVIAFANSPNTPDYLLNAQTLEAHIASRQSD